MRIDAHNHFWYYNPSEYAWINEEMSVIKKDRLPEHIYPEITQAGIGGSVAVQARQSLEETDFLVDLAKKNSFIKGVVGWFDLQSVSVEKELEKYSEIPQLCGVRHIVQDEPDMEFLLQPNFKRGISFLKKFGLPYDILIYSEQLPVSIPFVDAFPDQLFVLDHIAKPKIGQGLLSPWDGYIRQLAKRPNVFCKLSGMVTETSWHSWNSDVFIPYMDVVLEAFGSVRVIFGSDLPVCTLSGSYKEVFYLVNRYTASFSEEEKEAVFGGNAIRFYGLEI